jgi:hypothetical protein
LNNLITPLHNAGLPDRKQAPNRFDETSYIAATMTTLKVFQATDNAPAIGIFGSLSGQSAFQEPRPPSLPTADPDADPEQPP